MHALLKAIFYTPLYNGLVFFINIIPFHNVGVAVILFTVAVKIILFPLSQKAVRTQFLMKRLEPELAAIKERLKGSQQAQAEAVMALYKERGINPFSGVLLQLIQLPIMIALYYVFLNGGLPSIDHSLLYPFIAAPAAVNISFFGVSVGAKNAVFAFLAAAAQFFQMQVIMPKVAKRDAKAGPSFKDELSRSMNTQMKYVMPVIIFLIAENFAIVVSLYLITSSLFAIGQEIYVKRTYAARAAEAAPRS